MSDEQGFLETLATNPADDVTRLVYADWLDERGDPRGRYLRLEMELAELAAADPRLAGLEAELRELRDVWLSSEWCELAGKRWDVWLLAYHPHRKIMVIKVIRELTNMGLKDAKDLSEALPARVVADCWRGEAEGHCARLRQAATVPYAPDPAPEECAVLRPADGPAPRLGLVPGRLLPAVAPGESFDLYLLSYPPAGKIQTIKVIREVTGVGLKEAKDLSEAARPVLLRAGVPAAQVPHLQRAFDGVAEIELRPRAES
jgi:uncharacterized protein (TIGR02996 family)